MSQDCSRTPLPDDRKDSSRRTPQPPVLSTNKIVDIHADDYQVSLARNDEERDRIYRLRYRIFNLEMGEGLASSQESERDIDRFDPYCDLLQIQLLPQNTVVGTYRILSRENARGGPGFYSATEFDISGLDGLPGPYMEVGRSCVAADHRNGGVINLLWAGLAQYVEHYGIEYLFGCASLHCKDPDHVKSVNRLLGDRYSGTHLLSVQPLSTHRIDYLDDETGAPGEYDRQAAFRALPPLLRGYLRLGARMCGPPAFDPEFSCVDFLFLLPTKKIAARYRRHYFK